MIWGNWKHSIGNDVLGLVKGCTLEEVLEGISARRARGRMAGVRLCCGLEDNVRNPMGGGMAKKTSLYCHVRGWQYI